MSIRSLFEINHDFGHRIEREPEAFVRALDAYIRSGDSRTANALEPFGLRVIGQRHHSSEYRIDPKTDGFGQIREGLR